MRRIIVVASTLTFLLYSPVKVNASVKFEMINEDIRTGISGKVFDQDNKPVENVKVTINGKIVITNADGEYSFTELSEGTYDIIAEINGKKETVQVSIIRDKMISHNFNLYLDQSIDLSEVNVAAKRFAEKKSDMVARMPLSNLENSQVYTVVPKELLDEQVATDFRGALMSSPGVTNVSLGVGSGGTGLAMMMRGFTGADGAGAIRNGMATNYVSLSDPVNLDRLEIIKGPSSTLFGSTLVSYGGLVNRVTKQATVGEKGEVSISAGGYSLGRATLDYNKPLNKDNTLLFRINAAVHREKSFQDQGVNKTLMIAPTFKYLVSDRLTLGLDIEYFQSERNTTYVGLGKTSIKNLDELDWDFKRSYTSNDLTSKANVLNVFANANYIINDHWTSDTRFSYSNTDNNANYLFLLISDGTGDYAGERLLQRRIMNLPSNFNTTQIQQNFVGKHKWGDIENKFLVGVDFTQLVTSDSRVTVNDYDKSASTLLGLTKAQQTIVNQDAPTINSNTYETLLGQGTRAANSRNTVTYSAYVSDVIKFFDRLNVSAGVRVDRFNDKKNNYMQTAWSPKFGVVYEVIKNQLSLFGNYQNGFKNVQPTTLADNNRQFFKPEQSNQFETGIKFELLKGKINGTVSYYDIKVKDKVRTVPNTDPTSALTTISVQDATQKSTGFEFDLIANPFRGFHIIAGYGYNSSRFQKSAETTTGTSVEGNRPAGVPYNSANYWASYKLTRGEFNGLGFGFGGNYSDGYYFNDANTVKVSGFSTIDASIFYEKAKFRIALKGNNLANKKYWTTLSWAQPQQTRTFVANLTFKF